MSEENSSSVMIIWGALFLSQMIYLVVPHIIEIEQESPDNVFIIVLCTVGLGNALFSFVYPSIIKSTDVLTRSIIQFALLESCALMGLVCSLLGADTMYQYGLSFLSLGGMMMLFPKESVKGRQER